MSTVTTTETRCGYSPVSIPSPPAFSVSAKYGFLPPPSAPPLSEFADPYYAPWDKLAASLPKYLAPDIVKDTIIATEYAMRLRDDIQALPLLDTDRLTTKEELRRAFVVLGFLVHAHVWAGSGTVGGGRPQTIVPTVLAEPYLQVCAKLGMEQTLSYPGLCLWNWSLTTTGGKEKMTLEELDCLISFTGTRDEAVFYLVPVLVEAEGGKIVGLLLEAVQNGFVEERIEKVTNALEELSATLRSIGGLLRLLHQQCDPGVFFNNVRPFLAGAKGMEAKGMPRGMIFQRVNGETADVKCVGGSAAQSSLFQFIDLVLGVQHRSLDSISTETVFEEMRSYMPKEHRDFLKVVSNLPCLKQYVENARHNPTLYTAYNNCLKELASWRSKHIAVVTTHIVAQSRKAEAKSTPTAPEEVTDGLSVKDESKLQGTGGSALLPFLKQSKQETLDACL